MTRSIETRPCQCEHVAHFERHAPTQVLTPNGNPGHKYGVKFTPANLVRVNNSYEVCKDCREDCWHDR